MKTVEQIDLDIQPLLEEYGKTSPEKTATLKKLEKAIAELRLLRSFLLTNPKEIILQDRLSETVRKMEMKETYWKQYKADKSKQGIKVNAIRPMFEKDTGITELRSYLKTLQYLLF